MSGLVSFDKLRSLDSIHRLSYEEARQIIEAARWPTGRFCPHCGSLTSYEVKTRNRYKCAACGRQFAAFTGTIFSHRKLTIKELLAIAYVFARASKGISSINLSDLADIQQRSAWAICQKFRSAIHAEIQTVRLSGVIEIDGATFGGHMRWTNCGLTGRKHVKRHAQRCVVVVAKQRLGRTVPLIVSKEAEAKERLASIIAPGSIIVADQARGWDSLTELYDLLRVNHTFTFGTNSTACTNNAESFFSGMRKMHDGTHHWMSVKHMPLYAAELAWKRDAKDRGMSKLDLTEELLRLSLGHMPYYPPEAPSLAEAA